MSTVSRHLRGLLIAVVVLGLSAGVVLGARALPGAAGPGLARATDASGQAVPVRAARGDEEQEPVAEEAPEASAEPEESDAPNHGSIVSEAAGMATPDGFRNHGQFVSCVAHLAKDPAWAEFDWATLTPEDCEAAVASEEASDEPEVDASEEPESAEASNHGAIVSEAAAMATPDGFRNHGAFVSCVARLAKDQAWAPFDWSTLTPENCGQDTATGAAEETTVKAQVKANGKGKAGQGHGKAAKEKRGR